MGALWAVMKLGVRLKPLLVSVVALGGLALSWDALVIQLERNNQDSSTTSAST